MDSALSGLTVIEIPGGVATRYCGHLFAAHGATVLQLGRPSQAGVGYGGAGSEAYAAWLDGGKQPIDSYADAASHRIALVIAGQDSASVAAADAAMRTSGLDSAIRLALTWFA